MIEIARPHLQSGISRIQSLEIGLKLQSALKLSSNNRESKVFSGLQNPEFKLPAEILKDRRIWNFFLFRL